MTIREHAALHVQHRGIAPSEAALFLADFVRQQSCLMQWEATAPFLRHDLIQRIDQAAIAWCTARRFDYVQDRVKEFQLQNKRPLRSYSAEVLAEWIGRRGIAWFQEELDAIEARHSPRIYFPEMTEEPEALEREYIARCTPPDKVARPVYDGKESALPTGDRA